MKIAIFTDSFFPLTNGVVTFISDLSKGLADKGHKIYIICPKSKNNKEFQYKNVEVIRISGIPAFFYPGFKFSNFFSPKLYNYLKNEKIEIVHFHTPLSLGAQAIIIAKLLKTPLIGTYHTNIADPYYLKHIKINNYPVQKISWLYLKAYYNRCDLITCPSEETKKELSYKGFKNKLIYISNGINIPENLKAKKLKNKKEKILLFVGRIAYEKNIPYLLDCFSLVLKKMPNTKLFIIGDGPQFKEISDLIKQKKLSNNVIMTGRIEHKELMESPLIKSADLFVTASTTETQGISILEAQVNGLVSIGLNRGGVKDLIKDNYNGFLLEPGDKEGFANRIIELLLNKKLYNKMRKNTLKEIKKHDLKKIIAKWEKIYKTMIEENGKKEIRNSNFCRF